MYPTSRKWVNPRVREDSTRQALNNARQKICPNSFAWPKDLDLAKNNQEWKAAEQRRIDQIHKQRAQYLLAQPLPLRPAFGGATFDNNRSYVLGHETVFCPSYTRGKENMAPWPPFAENKYEGDDRISTDRLHARFPGAPRVQCADNIAWQARPIIQQFPLDDFYFPLPHAVDVFMRTHWIPELEFDDIEGKEVLGTELMVALDRAEQW